MVKPISTNLATAKHTRIFSILPHLWASVEASRIRTAQSLQDILRGKLEKQRLSYTIPVPERVRMRGGAWSRQVLIP